MSRNPLEGKREGRNGCEDLPGAVTASPSQQPWEAVRLFLFHKEANWREDEYGPLLVNDQGESLLTHTPSFQSAAPITPAFTKGAVE